VIKSPVALKNTAHVRQIQEYIQKPYVQSVPAPR